MAQSYLRSASIQRLPELMDWLREGELLIPAFQRELVWTGEQRLSLCDSIRRGLPSGSVMVWRTRREMPTGGFRGPFKQPADLGEKGARKQYLLDGQQRLSTLFGALGPALWSRNEEAVPWRDKSQSPSAPDGTPWQIGFDVTVEDGDFELIEDASSPRVGLLPLISLLDDSAYDDWREEADLDRQEKNRARAVRSAFVDYLIPVVPLVTDDLRPVTLTFKRVNSGGTDMGHFDMVRALSWASDFDLEKMVDDVVLPRLEVVGWSKLKRDDLLKVIATAYGMAPVEIEWEKLSKAISKDAKRFDSVSDSLKWAVKCLGDIGFGGPATLPSSYILVFAARAWQENKGDLTEEGEMALKKWLVEAAISGRFAGGTPTHMLQAAWRELAKKLKLPVTGKIRARRKRRSEPIKRSGNVNFGWGRPVITAAILAENHPLTATGDSIEQASEHLGQLGKEWYPRLLGSSDRALSHGELYLTAANRLVCGPNHLDGLRTAIRRSDCPAKVLESHAITSEAHQALLDGNIDEFFKARFLKIVELENMWLKTHGSSLRVPLPE